MCQTKNLRRGICLFCFKENVERGSISVRQRFGIFIFVSCLSGEMIRKESPDCFCCLCPDNSSETLLGSYDNFLVWWFFGDEVNCIVLYETEESETKLDSLQSLQFWLFWEPLRSFFFVESRLPVILSGRFISGWGSIILGYYFTTDL